MALFDKEVPVEHEKPENLEQQTEEPREAEVTELDDNDLEEVAGGENNNCFCWVD